ncbi:hypothetical protein F5J12DRAFT_23130 [Pisolithus orientalis]|nr:uncharacterized protein F5J12DRAFT_23130 [Pisolithus orientalis]KAI6035366.1 hypothetical protein F5J12DRAFT_23130 [Pisolithus orientalis]
MVQNTSSTPSAPEEHFDKAKKHLWATDPLLQGQCTSQRLSEPRQASSDISPPDDIDCHLGQTGTSSDPQSPRSKMPPENSECIYKTLSTRNQHVLPPLPREEFNFNQDRRLPLPRCWNNTDHSFPRERPPTSFCTASSPSSSTDPRGRNEGRQQRPSYPVSLSIFNSPTATYMWPSFQAASQMRHPPVIYVNYDSKDSTRSASTSSVSSLHNSPTISSPATSHPDYQVTNVIPRKRSSSPAERTSPDGTPSFTTLVKPLSHVYLGDKDAGPGNSQGLQQNGGRPRLPGHGPSNQVMSPNTSSNSASSDDERRAPREDSPQASEASERSITAGPVIRRPSPRGDGETWEKYAKPTLSADGTTRRWQCTWTATELGRVIDCQYTSKKQLVKRHVETTHLRFKPFVCEVCQKGFPQKTSLDTHMHGHTGSTPHVCRYECGMAFKDPARRHRHMVEEHGYVPRQSKKKHKVGQPTQEITDLESGRP